MFHHFLPLIESNIHTSRVDIETAVYNACSVVFSYPILSLHIMFLLSCKSFFRMRVAHGTHIPQQVETCFERQHGLESRVKFSCLKSRRKGKRCTANAPTPEQKEQQFQQEMRESLPMAALQRMSLLPLAEEWSVPVRPLTELNSAPGIALVSKDQLPSVIRAVGYTCHVCNIVASAPNQS